MLFSKADSVVRRMQQVPSLAMLLLVACGEPVPPPGTRVPVEPAPVEPASAPVPAAPPAAVVEPPPAECREASDCRLAMSWCPARFRAAPASAPPRRPGHGPAHRCPEVDQVPVAPACVDGRCVLAELDAPELRRCDADDECILAPRACHTTPIRADAREAFADVVGGAVCARNVHEAPAVCTLGVCVDLAWLAE